MTTVTKELISALRKADSIVLQYYEGECKIRLTRESKTTKDGGTLSYPDYEQPVDCAFDIYKSPEKPDGYGGQHYDATITGAFEMVSTHYGSGATVKYYLKEGDDIRVRWIANGASGYMYDLRCNHPDYYGQKLYDDTCRLVVCPKATGWAYNGLEIELGSSLCPNNSARMIKYY